jgi:hypothetical protein
MLKIDTYNYCQKCFEVMELVCTQGMKEYNHLLSITTDEIELLFYQEHFNEYKWYDV